MKVFRFLGDILYEQEFDSLSYYHVATFVKRVILDSESEQTKFEPMSLRQFVCQALDLRYEQSKVSQEIMISD